MKNLMFLLLISSPLHASSFCDQIVTARNDARNQVEKWQGNFRDLAYLQGIELGLEKAVSILEEAELVKKEVHLQAEPVDLKRLGAD